MISGKLPNPILVKQSEHLQLLAETLRNEPILAVDTESNSLFAYHEQVCLIQFSTTEADYIVDPLALKDISPLAPLFCDPNIEKVFHAAEYDLICLNRDFDLGFTNIFDTMVAARILGRKAVGLGSILEDEFGIYVDKRHQRANWGKRPLPDHLLNYARLDTHYLIPLRERLGLELEKRNLLPLAKEDFSRISKLYATNTKKSTEKDKGVKCWQISGSHDLEPQQAAVLLELCRYRDRVARSLNKPLFKVINDKSLIQIASQKPQNLTQLSFISGINPRQRKLHGTQLLKAVRRGLRAKPIHPPHPPRPDDDFLERLDHLRSWRRKVAEHMGVSSDIVLPRVLMFR